MRIPIIRATEYHVFFLISWKMCVRAARRKRITKIAEAGLERV